MLLLSHLVEDQNLNKAHVQFLRISAYRSREKPPNAAHWITVHAPQTPSLSEADTAEVEGFLADVLLCVPVLGYGFFEAAPLPKPMTNEFVLEGSKGVTATRVRDARQVS